MKKPKLAKVPATLRRSFALPNRLVEEARELSEPELRENLNRLVTTALEEYVTKRQRERFKAEMKKMAADPDICCELGKIQSEFAAAELDGQGLLH
jgi:hypothetical protein